jgi:hypothetical protein
MAITQPNERRVGAWNLNGDRCGKPPVPISMADTASGRSMVPVMHRITSGSTAYIVPPGFGVPACMRNVS